MAQNGQKRPKKAKTQENPKILMNHPFLQKTTKNSSRPHRTFSTQFGLFGGFWRVPKIDKNRPKSTKIVKNLKPNKINPRKETSTPIKSITIFKSSNRSPANTSKTFSSVFSYTPFLTNFGPFSDP